MFTLCNLLMKHNFDPNTAVAQKSGNAFFDLVF